VLTIRNGDAMSYGMFTVTRQEIHNPQELRQKLELATGDGDAAVRLAAELSIAADTDPATSSWHIVPDPAGDPRMNWRLQPMGP
jgi:hypothetical protein